MKDVAKATAKEKVIVAKSAEAQARREGPSTGRTTESRGKG